MSSNDKSKKPAPAPPRPWTDELEEDLQRILTVGEECISAEELKKLLLAKGRGSEHPTGNITLYDGFEPSGRMHIAQGVFKAMNVNKCTFEGTNATFVFWVADWFALMNDKMGGDLDKIKTVGKYLIQVWKAAGMNLENVVFKWASEEITNNAHVYWPTMLDVARRFNITRIKKCCQIMGRKEGSLTSAQVLYPLMQCTDVFFLKADICQLGVDQRKVNMLAREYCEAAKIKNKPIILSHHMLYGLKAGQEKMSKSDPDSAVFMEDVAEDVERKIMNAYCPTRTEEKQAKNDADAPIDAGLESMHLVEDDIKNPCLDYIQNIIFSPPNATYTAGGTTYTDFGTVREKFLAGEISETDLKRGLVNALNVLLEPVRNHFTNDEEAKELLRLVQQYKKETTSTASSSSPPRRLDLAALDMVPAGGSVVFAPLPDANPTLQSAVGTLLLLRKAVAAATSSSSTVLFLSDWSARVCNACNADLKGIDAYYSVFVTALTALDSETMSKVQVLKQSEAILADPSNYWISVIHAGRKFSLQQVMGASLVDSNGVGSVIARLMRVADVAGLAASTIYLSTADETDPDVMTGLIGEFVTEHPPIVSVDSEPELQLQVRDSDAHKTENDEYYLLDDPKVHGKSKMKKAFCEPGNVSFCPPIVLASTFGLDLSSSNSSIVIPRSPENGGDATFSDRSSLETAFAEESLHPGDLKTAASTILVQTLESIATAMKNDGDATKASKTLKALAKKLAKKK